ncbi:phage tail tape measure protein, partial [Verrucosispora sp. NA02020]|uniref:phage tail tape measure protein n=1 Tax=Verrucosispora sp. NA02020 TaxID=2742132 RepID=UPI003D73AA1B
MNRAGQSTRDFIGEMDKAAKADQLDNVAMAAGGVGLSLVALTGTALKFRMDFEKQLSAVQAATKASGAEMELLREAALKAGKDTAYSATEAGQAIEELAKAGVDTADILRGGLAGALDLAAAGGLDVAEAAETAASAMTQFQLDGSKVPHIADLLAAAAGKAQGSVHDMGYALSQAGLVSAQMGMSIEDTTGTLAAFASAGLLGSDAGTSLKTALLMLANPTEKSAELMAELGINTYDAHGNFVGVVDLAGQLKTQLGGLTQAQRNAAMATIFGSDAIRAASILYERGAHGMSEWIGKVNDQGYAAETARIKTDNLAGDVERLTGALETLAIESGEGASNGLRKLVQGADRLVESVSSIPGPVQSTAVVVAGVGGAALLAAAGAVKLRQATAGALDELRQTGPVGTRAAAGLERTGKAAGRAAVGLAAMQAAGALMGSNLDAQTDVLGKRMLEFARSGDVGGEAARLFGDDLSKLDEALHQVADTGRWSTFERGFVGAVEGITGLGPVFDDTLFKRRERLLALDQALANMVQSGNGQQAAEIFDTVRKRAAEQGVSLRELTNVLPGYAAAVEMAGSASEGAAGSVGKVGESAEEAAKRVEDLKAAFDSLFDSQMTADRAALKSADAIEALDETFRKHKSTIDITTES